MDAVIEMALMVLLCLGVLVIVAMAIALIIIMFYVVSMFIRDMRKDEDEED